LILLISQIINADLISIHNDFKNFISANEYSILLLIAVDMLISQFSKDRQRVKLLSEKIEKYLAENRE